MDASAAPPRTVKSSAATTTRRPSTRARPVTKLVGVSSVRLPSSSYVAEPVRPPTSANDSLSTRRSMRSRTVSRAAACCRETRSSPPICAASPRRCSSSAGSGSHSLIASRSSRFAVDASLGLVRLRDDGVGEQLLHLVRVEAPVEQGFARVLAWHPWGSGDRARRAREPRRGRRLHEPVDVDERLPGTDVRVRRRLTGGQHRRDASVHTIEQRGPLVTRPGGERPLEKRTHLGPAGDVVLTRKLLAEAKSGLTEHPHQLREELSLECTDRNPPAVRALVGVVERRTAVEQVAAALVLPDAGRAVTVQHRQQS